MNFLGHLYFSRNDHDLMLANLFGDFVKGKDLSHFRVKTQKGIYLHRCIDSYIDNHPAVHDLLQILYPQLPKVAGLAIDLYFDHLLAVNWADFHKEKLESFIQEFYNSVNLDHVEYSDEFKFMIEKMIEKNWIYYYQFEYGLNKACQGVSRRISFQNELINGVEVYNNNRLEIERAFFLYMADAQVYLNAIELTSVQRKTEQ